MDTSKQMELDIREQTSSVGIGVIRVFDEDVVTFTLRTPPAGMPLEKLGMNKYHLQPEKVELCASFINEYPRLAKILGSVTDHRDVALYDKGEDFQAETVNGLFETIKEELNEFSQEARDVQLQRLGCKHEVPHQLEEGYQLPCCALCGEAFAY